MEADRHGFAGGDLAGTAAARPENTAAGKKALREKLTAKAAALVPLLRAKAAEIEREGAFPTRCLRQSMRRSSSGCARRNGSAASRPTFAPTWTW